MTLLSSSGPDGLVDDEFRAFKSGDKLALSPYFHRYSTELYRFVLTLVKNDEDAKDIVQESFFKLWRGAEKIETQLHIKTFLYTVARNASIDHLRKKNRINTLLRNLSYLPDTDNLDAETTTSEQLGWFYRQLGKLAPSEREVLELYLSGKKTKEIAAIRNSNSQTVLNLRTSAINKLKNLLSGRDLLRFLILFLSFLNADHQHINSSFPENIQEFFKNNSPGNS